MADGLHFTFQRHSQQKAKKKQKKQKKKKQFER
jgi:hypothetical protein